MKIKLSDLKKKPCDRYHDYIKENYGEEEFDPMAVFEVLNPSPDDVRWLIKNVEICQTEEWFKYYKSLNPSLYGVSGLIINLDICQTEEWVDYFKSLDPIANNVSMLIKKLEICQTEDWFEYYKSLNPSAVDLAWLKIYCEKFRRYEAGNENKIK